MSFYDTTAIETAKQVLYSCDAVVDCGVSHQRRQGPSKDETNMEDIRLAFHRCSGLLEFVASDLSRLPPLNMHNIDFAHLLHEFQGMRAEMATFRDEVKLVKVNTQVPQRDGPWSKPNKVACAVNNLPLVVNLPAAPQEKSSKAAPPKTNAPNVVKRVSAVVSSETCESEPVDNQQHDESDEHGFTRVTRKRPARNKPKAVTWNKEWCVVESEIRKICVCVCLQARS